MSGEGKDDSKVTHSDIHEKLWAARDFEINHLWQRSIFLATFITLAFTLYFTAVDKFTADYPSYRVEAVTEEQDSKGSCYINVLPSEIAGRIDNVSSIESKINGFISDTEDEYSGLSEQLNSFDADEGDAAATVGIIREFFSSVLDLCKGIKGALDEFETSYDSEDFLHILILHGICILGFCLSVLWICMARGSKYMYERLEQGIDKAYTADSGFLDKELGDAIRNEFYENLLAMGEYTYLPRHGALPLSDYNYHAFSLDGAKFSSSKINIMLGYLLVGVWIVLTMLNPAFVGQNITLVADWRGILFAGAIAFILLLLIFRRKVIAILTAFIDYPCCYLLG